MKYSTIQQHEPLRVPSGWGASEKRFIAQLEEIFDDLYRRFNRLKMSDLGQELQNTIKGSSIELIALRSQIDNLLPDSKRERASARFLSVDVHEILADHIGETITVSFEIKGETARPFIVYPYQDRGVSISERHEFTMPLDWARYSFTTTVKDWGLEAAGTSLGEIAWYDQAGAQNYTVRKIKIELGTEATEWAPSLEDAEALENSAVRIDPGGIKMKGGKLEFEAGSAINFLSNGTFYVFAVSDDSVIKFGGTEQNPNFSLGAGGQVKAKKVFTDDLELTNGRLLSALSGSLANTVIVSDTQPSGHGLLWIQPSGGGGGTIDYTLASSGGEDMTPADNTVTLTGFTGTGSVTGNCTYGVQFRIYNYSGTCNYYKVTVTLSDGTNSVQVLDETVNQWVRPGDYFDVNTLNTPSSSLTNITGGNLSMTVRLQKFDSNHDPVSTGARFEVGQPFSIRAVGSSGQGTTQVCTVNYIP